MYLNLITSERDTDIALERIKADRFQISKSDKFRLTKRLNKAEMAENRRMIRDDYIRCPYIRYKQVIRTSNHKIKGVTTVKRRTKNVLFKVKRQREIKKPLTANIICSINMELKISKNENDFWKNNNVFQELRKFLHWPKED